MKLSEKYLLALIYIVVVFLDRLDLTIVNITLPTVAKTFHVSVVSTDWVNLAFLLALAIAIPISTWLAERFGYKRIYILAMCLFGFGSTLCAFAPNLDSLIFLRFVHGLGGGMLIPVGATMIYRAYDKAEYASITSYIFLPSLVAPAIGPFLGGLILDLFSWRWVFFFSGPICLCIALISAVYIKEIPYMQRKPLDLYGFLLSAAMLIIVFYAFSLLGKDQITLAMSLLAFVLAPLLLAFIRVESRSQYPLINLDFFRNKTFVKANMIQLCFQTCHFGAIFLVGLFLQIGEGFSATMAGLVMGMQALGAMAVSRYSVKLFNQYGAQLPIGLGLLGVAVLTPMILWIHQGVLVFALLLFFVRGLASGLCGTPIQTLSVIGFSKEDLPSVNTVFSACRQVSVSFGVALSSVLIGLSLRAMGLHHDLSVLQSSLRSAFVPAFWALPVVALIGIFLLRGLAKSP